jgi:MazG family protein
MDHEIRELGKLRDVMESLRGPGGCPWDRERTIADLGRYLLEETCEVTDAIAESGGQPSAKVCEELGDVLMNIFLAALIAKETESFSIADVAAGIRQKLIRRHPHVFGDTQVAGVEDVLHRWREIKKAERAGTAEEESRRSRLDAVPRSLPPLARAQRLTEEASRCGFDWPQAEGALGKVEEELGEVRELLAMPTRDCQRLEEELGDMLFSVVNLCRKLDVHADAALLASIRKFSERFQRIERRLGKLEDASLEEMDRIWDEGRRGGAGSSSSASASGPREKAPEEAP